MVVNKKNTDFQRQKIISNGGSVKEKKQWTSLCLRIPQDMVNEVDICVDKRIGMNRTAWILEAIQEKLEQRKSNE